jgi:hypothetical protein
MIDVSYAGLTRVSIKDQPLIQRRMDCRVKPGNDKSGIVSRLIDGQIF